MSLSPDQEAALFKLPRFYNVATVVEEVFGGNFTAFADAWVDGSLPAHVTTALRDVIAPTLEQTLWLRRIAQQNDRIIQLLVEQQTALTTQRLSAETPR